MSNKHDQPKSHGPFTILASAVNILFHHPVTFIPYIFSAFIQLLFLEILYFYPRYPLNIVATPLINKIWSPIYMHYPLNLTLIPRLFQPIQILLYIFISSFCIAISIASIGQINTGSPVNLKGILKKSFGRYPHVVLTFIIIFVTIFAYLQGYNLIINRALLIRSESGKFFLLKQLIINGAPYFNLLMNIVATTIFAYVLPAIMLDKKKISSAIGRNFQYLWKKFIPTFIMALVPSLFFIPVVLLRNSLKITTMPELNVWMLVVGIIVMIFVDAIVYTAFTTYYLIKKEHS